MYKLSMKFTKFSVILHFKLVIIQKMEYVDIWWVLSMRVESKYLLFLFSLNVWIHGATKWNSDTCVMHSESSFSRPGTIKLLDWRKKIEKYLTFLVCTLLAIDGRLYLLESTLLLSSVEKKILYYIQSVFELK